MKLKCLLVTPMWKVFGEFLRFSNLKLKRTHDTQSLPVGKIGARVLCARIHTILCCQTIRHHWLNSKIENFHSFATQLNSIAFSLSAASFWLLCLASHTITDTLTGLLAGWLVGCLAENDATESLNPSSIAHTQSAFLYSLCVPYK